MIECKVAKKYWDDNWAMGSIPDAVDPRRQGLNEYKNRCFHEYFCAMFSTVQTRGKNLLEIGCARSAWLPYFAKEFGFNVYGLDYSELGCKQARQILSKANVQGEVVCADFFSPPDSIVGGYDVVVSFGVAEHFKDTVACIKNFSQFLKPHGMMITNVPNLIGLAGIVQKILNQPVYDIHKPLDPNTLAKAHQLSGLQVLDCNYFMTIDFSICNLNGIPPDSVEWFVKRNVLLLLIRLSKIIWLIEDKFGPFKSTRLTSPYINCAARKLESIANIVSVAN